MCKIMSDIDRDFLLEKPRQLDMKTLVKIESDCIDYVENSVERCLLAHIVYLNKEIERLKDSEADKSWRIDYMREMSPF